VTTSGTPEQVPTHPPAIHDRTAALTALAALYQGEKTDASYIFNTAMALMGIAITYIVFAVPSVDSLSSKPHAWVFLILLPTPLWLIAAFHSLITLNAMSHGVSVQAIEDQLFDASELWVRRDLVGSAAGDKIMDINKSKLIHRLTTFFVYAGVFFLIVGFTYYAVLAATEVKGGTGPAPMAWVWSAAIAYALSLLMVGASWMRGVGLVNKGREEIAHHVKRFGRQADAAARLDLLDESNRFPDLSESRRLIGRRDVALSKAVIDDRNDRL
jgi:hypothetical protein